MDISQSDSAMLVSSRSFSPMINKLGLLISDVGAFLLAFAVTYWVMGGIGGELPDELSSLSNGIGYARIWSFAIIVLCGVTWFWAQMRHYTYRKPF